MLYRTAPRIQDELPILGFGCMRFPEKTGIIDEERSKILLRYAIDNGVTYLDTAWMYHHGKSESFVGRALADGYREKVKLATKLPHWLVKSREDMDWFLDAQCARLNTSYIDYYLIHSIGKDSWGRMKNLGAMDFLDKAKKDGRIRHAGFSFHEDTRTFKQIVDDYTWDFCQIQYNILDEFSQAGREGLTYAANQGLAVIIMEPLRGGKLAQNPPDEITRIWDKASVRRTPAEWALRWLWDQPEVTMVLSGMNDISQIDENCNTADSAYPGSLRPDEQKIIGEVSDTWRSLMKIPCTGCQYCMPCPFGVNIPSCFEMYNDVHMFGDGWRTNAVYAARLGGIMSGISHASVCVECGSCLSSCPQKLPIPDLLRDVSARFEGPFFHILVPLVKAALPFIRRCELLKNSKLNRIIPQ